jgi:hypothetical protein
MKGNDRTRRSPREVNRFLPFSTIDFRGGGTNHHLNLLAIGEIQKWGA